MHIRHIRTIFRFSLDVSECRGSDPVRFGIQRLHIGSTGVTETAAIRTVLPTHTFSAHSPVLFPTVSKQDCFLPGVYNLFCCLILLMQANNLNELIWRPSIFVCDRAKPKLSVYGIIDLDQMTYATIFISIQGKKNALHKQWSRVRLSCTENQSFRIWSADRSSHLGVRKRWNGTMMVCVRAQQHYASLLKTET